ncbi:MAG: NAD(P)-dependent oxidoreductase [Kiloniellales bacterium]
MAKQTIGFLGIGIMGFQMARRLAEAGHAVTAWNRSRDKAERLQAFGVKLADKAADAVRSAEAVICMLSSGPVCDEVLIEGGVLEAMPIGSVVIVMSSIPVETAQAQAETAARRGLRYLDAPVSGGEKGAAEGTLAIMVGGEPTTFADAKPVFEEMGRPTLVGPAGSGELAKLANQVIVANTIATVSEALLLAKAGGADIAAVRQALLGGFADSTILRLHGECMIAGNFKPGAPAKHQLKDQRTATGLAQKLGVALPVSELVQRLFEEMVEYGGGDTDHSGLFVELHRRNGLVYP